MTRGPTFFRGFRRIGDHLLRKALGRRISRTLESKLARLNLEHVRLAASVTRSLVFGATPGAGEFGKADFGH